MLKFDPTNYIRQIVLVGCGGTGAQLARSVARLMRMMQDAGKSTPEVLFVDPDIVEAKNVGRQLFSEGMIGMSKAFEVARRFNYALGLDIQAAVEPFDAKKHANNPHATIILGAVDNWAARAEINRAERAIWIDCGNSRHSGQVVMGNTGKLENMMEELTRNRDPSEQRFHDRSNLVRYLPNAGLLYPQLLEPDPDQERLAESLSCAERLALSLQSPTINQFVASIAAEYLRKLLYREDIYTWHTTINTTTLNMRSTPITLDTLLKQIPGLDPSGLTATE